jgi:hypothetical protein
MVEARKLLCTNLASYTSFAYPCSHNVCDCVVEFVIVFETPHILDSVVLTKSSFDDGLLGSHIAALCCSVNDNDDNYLGKCTKNSYT